MQPSKTIKTTSIIMYFVKFTELKVNEKLKVGP